MTTSNHRVARWIGRSLDVAAAAADRRLPVHRPPGARRAADRALDIRRRRPLDGRRRSRSDRRSSSSRSPPRDLRRRRRRQPAQRTGAAIFTHRIVRIAERAGAIWIETKGDANATADPSLTPATGGHRSGGPRAAGGGLRRRAAVDPQRRHLRHLARPDPVPGRRTTRAAQAPPRTARCLGRSLGARGRADRLTAAAG